MLDNKGTTLIELIVGIAIIGLVTGAVLANFRIGERTNNLHMATQKLISDIRQAQDYAMSLKSHGGSIPPGGWGFYFNITGTNSTSYTIFADTDGNHYCDNFNLCRDNKPDYYKKIEFPKGIEITQLYPNSTPLGKLHFSFEPPTPKVYFCNDNTCSANDVKITLTGDGQTKTITINKFGLIDVE